MQCVEAVISWLIFLVVDGQRRIDFRANFLEAPLFHDQFMKGFRTITGRDFSPEIPESREGKSHLFNDWKLLVSSDQWGNFPLPEERPPLGIHFPLQECAS